MNTVDIDGPPETKRYRMDVNTSQTDLASVSTNCSVATPIAGEASQDGQSPAAPSSASYRSSNASVVSSGDSPVKEEDTDCGELINDESEGSTVGTGSSINAPNPCDLLDIISKTMLNGVFTKLEDGYQRPSSLLASISTPSSPQSLMPGAIAVAQTPAAQLFAEDDWSWHRNPAASIRSGGTNKQTPVWKYFVYNKVENLSRCIVGDCSYMLKGPHTSTLACHLKKHTKEYAEFQKLKSEYSRTKMEVQSQQPKDLPSIIQQQQQQQQQQHLQQQNVQRQASPIAQTIDLSIKKTKKEISNNASKLNDMNFIMANLRAHSQNGSQSKNQSAITTPTSATNQNFSPTMMQNFMMNINPMMMFAAQSMPSGPPANGLSALQQTVPGLSLSANGHLIQSKKWRNDEKKQRELQTRLALAVSSSHLSFEILQNQMWKDLFEFAQPKFNLNTELVSFDQSVASINGRMSQNLKSMMSTARKLNLLVDTAKVSADVAKISIAVALTSGAGNSYETQVILLAFKNLAMVDNVAEEVSKTLDMVKSEYGIADEAVNRVVCSGFRNVIGEDSSCVLEKQIESFSSRLLACFLHWIDTSVAVDSLRKTLFSSIFSILTNQAAVQIATKLNGGKFEVPFAEPFPILLDFVMSAKECFQMKTNGHTGLDEEHWQKLTGLHNVCNIFKPLVGYSNDMATIDTAIPSLLQIKQTLEKDIYQIGEMAAELLEVLNDRMGFATDINNEDFDPVYIQATALNPQLAVTLSQGQISIAREIIEREVSRRMKRKIVSSKSSSNKNILPIGVDSLLANVIKGGGEACEALSMYGDFFNAMGQEDSEKVEENIMNQYFEEISNSAPVENLFNPLFRTFGNPMQAPLSYWKTCAAKCPILSELAIELISLPIFTLTTERAMAFTPTLSPYTQLNVNQILANIENADVYEKQLILRFNRSIVQKLI